MEHWLHRMPNKWLCWAIRLQSVSLRLSSLDTIRFCTICRIFATAMFQVGDAIGRNYNYVICIERNAKKSMAYHQLPFKPYYATKYHSRRSTMFRSRLKKTFDFLKYILFKFILSNTIHYKSTV